MIINVDIPLYLGVLGHLETASTPEETAL